MVPPLTVGLLPNQARQSMVAINALDSTEIVPRVFYSKDHCVDFVSGSVGYLYTGLRAGVVISGLQQLATCLANSAVACEFWDRLEDCAKVELFGPSVHDCINEIVIEVCGSKPTVLQFAFEDDLRRHLQSIAS